MKDHSRLSKKRIFSNVGSRRRSSHATLSFTQECKNIWEHLWESYFNIMSCFLFKSVCDIYVLFLVSLLTRSLTLLWQKPYTSHRIYEAWTWTISIGCTCMQKHLYPEGYVRRSIYVRTHTSHEGFFCIYGERSGFHKRSRTAPTYNLLQPKYSQTLMLYEYRPPLKVLVWSDLTLCTSVASSNIEKYAKYPRFSQTISHCTDIQPPTTKIFSNTYVMWITISPQGVSLVGFDFVYKCGFVEYWKKREISTSASENVDFIGSTVGFDIKKVFTIGPISNIDAL